MEWLNHASWTFLKRGTWACKCKFCMCEGESRRSLKYSRDDSDRGECKFCTCEGGKIRSLKCSRDNSDWALVKLVSTYKIQTSFQRFDGKHNRTPPFHIQAHIGLSCAFSFFLRWKWAYVLKFCLLNKLRFHE